MLLEAEILAPGKGRDIFSHYMVFATHFLQKKCVYYDNTHQYFKKDAQKHNLLPTSYKFLLLYCNQDPATITVLQKTSRWEHQPGKGLNLGFLTC